MAITGFPYSYYRCSCANLTPATAITSTTTASRAPAAGAATEPQQGTTMAPPQDDDDEDSGEEEESSFDPGNPRSSYSLYPLDNLMWCEDCHDIRCSRCTAEEIVCWYCPNCLFEVPSSTVKTDGNRCIRNCFNCPECMAQLQTLSLDADPSGTHGPYILNCTYCNWNSTDIGLTFDSPRHILEQLQKNAPHKQRRIASRTGAARLETVPEPGNQGSGDDAAPRDSAQSTASARKPQDAATRFANLKTFYQEQTKKASPADALRSPGMDMDYSSPGNLQRIMNMYSAANSSALGRQPAERPKPMREAKETAEGLALFSPEADAAIVQKLRDTGLAGTTSVAQRKGQQGINDAQDPRFLTDLRPTPTLLCTKRSSRCSVCRHILVKPEPKVTTMRYRIKLIAAEKVPSMSLKPLIHPASTFSSSQQPNGVQSGNSSPTKSTNMADIDLRRLPAQQTLQFLLKLTNPMFDAVKVSLATPSEIPSSHGRAASRVTILCPEFAIGANSDMWDEALSGPRGGAGSGKDGSSDGGAGAGGDDGSGGRTAVAGRVWDRGRNWTTVVVEVVPQRPSRWHGGKKDGEKQGLQEPHLGREDEDVLEIPVFVRLNYDAETTAGAGGDAAAMVGGTGKERKEKRTLGYWAVLGVGRIALD